MEQTEPLKFDHPLDRASRLLPGGRHAMAEKLGVKIAAIGNWKLRDSIPVEYCADIETMTAGQVSRKDLRPDDWQRIWPELATKKQE